MQTDIDTGKVQMYKQLHYIMHRYGVNAQAPNGAIEVKPAVVKTSPRTSARITVLQCTKADVTLLDGQMDSLVAFDLDDSFWAVHNHYSSGGMVLQNEETQTYKNV